MYRAGHLVWLWTVPLGPGIIHSVDPTDDEELVDVESASYASLDEIEPHLAGRCRGAYLDRFFAVSELSPLRRLQAEEMLAISRGVTGNGELVLRFEFPFMGSTTWHEWDGSESAAVGAAEEEGQLKGADVRKDQARHGATGWEQGFDSEDS